jgi:hypothetical protein
MPTRTIIWEISLNTRDFSSIRLPSQIVEDVSDKYKYVPVNSWYCIISVANFTFTLRAAMVQQWCHHAGIKNNYKWARPPLSKGPHWAGYFYTWSKKGCSREMVREGKVVPELNKLSTTSWTRMRECRYSFTILDLDRGEWSASSPCRYTPGTHWIGGCMGPTTGLDAMK